MLELNRSVIMGDMGKKIYRMIMQQKIKHSSYDKVVFLIKKFKHLEQKGPGKDEENKGFWARIQEAAGVEKESEHTLKMREKVREQMVELGRVAFELSYKENILYPDLHMEYIELESVVKKIREKREAMGLGSVE